MALDFVKLLSDVANQNTVVGGVVTLLQALAEKLKKALLDLAAAIANEDPDAEAQAQGQIDAIATQLEANTQALADAVAANTPAE